MISFLTILRGFIIGVSNAVPGVSGGTVIYLTGIYEEFIEAISNITDIKDENFQKRLFFLTQLIIGIFCGGFLISKILSGFLESKEEILRFFFLGLTLFSIPSVINSKEKKLNKRDIIFMLLGLLIVMFMNF